MKKIILASVLFSVMTGQLFAQQYEVTVKGQRAGKAELQMDVSDNSYHVELAVYPNGLAKLFGIDDMIDSASGTLKKGHYYPKAYGRKEVEGKQLLSVDFSSNQVNTTGKDGAKQFTIETMAQDPLTQILQIQTDLKNQQLASHYFLVTENNQQRYDATKTSDKVVLKQQGKGTRMISLWFDKDYQLTRMQKQKRGKVQFDMKIL